MRTGRTSAQIRSRCRSLTCFLVTVRLLLKSVQGTREAPEALNPKPDYWVAVKELKLSYHSGYI